MKLLRWIFVALILFTAISVISCKKKHKHEHKHHQKRRHNGRHDKDSHSDNRDVKKAVSNLLRNLDIPVLPTLEVSSVFTVGSITDSSSSCQDRSTLCQRYTHYCEHPNVKKYCKSSCNRCEDEIREVPCEDKRSENYCSQVKRYGYCSKPVYKPFILNNCKRTCDMCEKGFKCGVAPLRQASGGNVIVGGTSASKSYWPWQVAIFYDGKFICGGTLISRQYITSAAHCFSTRSKDVRRYMVVLGEHNRDYEEKTEQRYGVDVLTIYPKYVTNQDEHDIAVLKMDHPAAITDHVVPACLPTPYQETKAGTKCYVTGWGSTRIAGPSSSLLQELQLPIAAQDSCKTRNAFNFHQVTESMICAGYDVGESFASACHGDSGGPLVCESSSGKWTLHGVVSWGSPICSGYERYTVFTKVSHYVDWIRNLMENR